MEVPEGFYEKKTEYGDILVKEYSFAGRIYRQETLSLGQMMEISDILADLSIPGLNDLTDIGNGVSVGVLIRVLAKNRLLPRVISLVLFDAENGHPDPNIFEHSTADAFFALAEEVFSDFFEFNSTLGARLLGLFATIFERAAKVLPSALVSGTQSIPSRTGTLPSSPKSSGSGKRKRSRGSR